MAKSLSQHDIDAAFKSLTAKSGGRPSAELFDFGRPDRIARSQLRSIQLIHDTFIRAFTSSLSAYLRTYLSITMVGVEQLSFGEFIEGLRSPTCLASLSHLPYEGHACLEISPSLIFPILELLLGGSGKASTGLEREITEIEQKILDGVFRLILHDLKEAWKPVTNIEFKLECLETDPQALQVIAPTEGVVVISIEIRMGETIGMMNIALPSIMIRMMRQKFGKQWSPRRSESTPTDQHRLWGLIRSSRVNLEVFLEGPVLLMNDVLDLKEGDVVKFDYPVEKALTLKFNGKSKYQGQMLSIGNKLAVAVDTAPSVS